MVAHVYGVDDVAHGREALDGVVSSVDESWNGRIGNRKETSRCDIFVSEVDRARALGWVDAKLGILL